MNRKIRQLALGLMACYVVLFVALNYWQVGRKSELDARFDNTRSVMREFNRPRGPIVSADGVVGEALAMVLVNAATLLTKDLDGALTLLPALLPALEAVMRGFDTENVDALICLGDTVGYGSQPNECADIVRKNAKHTILGNHDAAVAGRMDYSYYYDAAREAQSAVDDTEERVATRIDAVSERGEKLAALLADG